MLPFQQTTDLVEKLRAQNVVFEELIFPDEIHDLLRWNGWARAYRATAEFFDRKLPALGVPRKARRGDVGSSLVVLLGLESLNLAWQPYQK